MQYSVVITSNLFCLFFPSREILEFFLADRSTQKGIHDIKKQKTDRFQPSWGTA